MTTDAAQNARRNERRRMMLEDPVIRVIPALSVPMVISMLIDSFYNLADTFFVSQLGTYATAAVGVNDALMLLIRALGMGFGMGAASYISRLLGAKQEEESSRVGVTALFSSLAATAVIAALMLFFIQPLVRLLGSTANSQMYTMQYARFILLSAPFTVGEVVLSQLLRAEGSTQYSMIGMVSGCFLNIALDPLFINVFGWGVAGAAGATALSKIVSFCVLLAPFVRRKTLISLHPSLFTPKAGIYLEIARMGLPSFLRTLLFSLGTIVTNNIAGGFGDTALAAVSVGNKCMRFIGSMIIGFSQGFQPLAGYCWGAKKYRRVREAFRVTTLIGVGIAVFFGLLMGIFSQQIVSVFTAANDPDIIYIGSMMIRAQCLTMICHMWVMISSGMFQALGHAISATILNLSRQVICLIPCVIILSMLFGVEGLACAQAAADVVAALIALPLVLRMTGKLQKLADAEDAFSGTEEAPEPSCDTI